MKDIVQETLNSPYLLSHALLERGCTYGQINAVLEILHAGVPDPISYEDWLEAMARSDAYDAIDQERLYTDNDLHAAGLPVG